MNDFVVWIRQSIEFQVSSIFVACKVTMRKDIQCAQFLIPYITSKLPFKQCNLLNSFVSLSDFVTDITFRSHPRNNKGKYILVYALCEGTNEDREEILKEFEAVLKMSSSSKSLDLNISGIGDQLKRSASGHDLKYLASQTLFSILDHMNKWLRIKYLSLTERMKKMDDPEVLTSKDQVCRQYQ